MIANLVEQQSALQPTLTRECYEPSSPDAEIAWKETQADSARAGILMDLTNRIQALGELIYAYCDLDDPNLDTDDEILNWTFTDVHDDLRTALLALAAGCYKTSAATLRSAFELSIVSLYFQLRQNQHTRDDEYNPYFSNWDSGDADTPNWGTTKPFLKKHQSFIDVLTTYNLDLFEELHSHFHVLSSYTHNRAYTRDKAQATNVINMGAFSPKFDVALFKRFATEMELVLCGIASAWLIAFPQLAAKVSLTDEPLASVLGCCRWGQVAVTYVKQLGNT